MIHPLIPFTLRGVIWYQGESNIRSAHRYSELMKALISEWRARWGQATFPFYLVQLANLHSVSPEPASTAVPSVDDAAARLREAQLIVSQTVPESGLAVAIDVGETSIHPLNKQDVGNRLARIALARTYGCPDIPHQGPVYDSLRREGTALIVNFKDGTGGLMVAEKKGLEPARETPGAPLRQFAIAGADRKFVWAEARIEGNSVRVSSAKVLEPVAVRYAWSENPEGRNLYGANGLPASPFRTDDFPAPKR
jgi:sialate O-acetylesterase